MKEATGEVSMTVVTLVAIAVIGGIIALLWPKIQERINNLWDTTSNDCNIVCPKGKTLDTNSCRCK